MMGRFFMLSCCRMSRRCRAMSRDLKQSESGKPGSHTARLHDRHKHLGHHPCWQSKCTRLPCCTDRFCGEHVRGLWQQRQGLDAVLVVPRGVLGDLVLAHHEISMVSVIFTLASAHFRVFFFFLPWTYMLAEQPAQHNSDRPLLFMLWRDMVQEVAFAFAHVIASSGSKTFQSWSERAARDLHENSTITAQTDESANEPTTV
jgi:hypothetical protein